MNGSQSTGRPTADRPLRRGAAVAALAIGLCVLSAGCAQRLVRLRATPYNPLAAQLSLYARGGPTPSDRTVQLLRRYDLPSRVQGDGRDQLDALARFYERERNPEIVYALAELSYIGARKVEVMNSARAQELYLDTVRHAYAYLFDGQFDFGRNAYDPQFRGACDLYNGALESCLRIMQQAGQFAPGRTLQLVSGGEPVEVSIEPRGFNWVAGDFDAFRFVSDFNVVGLKNVHRTYGLGVPLIAVRRTGSAPPAVEQYYASSLSFPVTAFLRFDGGPSGHSTADSRVAMRLELYDPLEVTDVHIAGARVPLESDISTPLAYFLDNPQIQHLDTYGLLRPDKARQIAGLYMVQPYQPGKIPVLMVHGIWSSPMTWMEALNDLRAMPEIRERYQFWFYLYPTGVPFWETAANLRADLAEVRRVFAEGGGLVDAAGPSALVGGPSASPRPFPAGYHTTLQHDPALDQMVLVGHSMGGLISRLITYDSGDAYWRTVSDAPFELVQAPPDVKENIRRVYFFEPDASVRRVITIGSPYRGSSYASDALRLLGRRFIALPMQTVGAARQLLTLNPDIFRDEWAPVGLTSLDGLSPDNPILQTMLATPRPPWVDYHNVVGAIKDLPVEQNTDGVVTFASAHREDVESEVIVAAEHSQLHRHPRTILEIRRILLEHLAEMRDDPSSGVVPVEHQRQESGGMLHAPGDGHSRPGRP